MTVNADTIQVIVEKVKKFLNDLVHPNMTIDTIAEVANSELDDIIKTNKDKGLNYSAGRFTVKYVDKKHFAFEFEMYFKDDAGKWYKAANESEPRDAELLDPKTWEQIQKRKSIIFPIGDPAEAEIPEKEISSEPEKITSTPNKAEEITLEKLMGQKEKA